jgi:group I intron endonuclease
MIGIYKITNPKGKIYIGQSINIKIRWERDYKKINCKHQPKLYNSLLKYGFENHKFEIVEECSLEQLNKREIHWGQYYNTLTKGLNCKLGDANGLCSKKTKEKMSKAKLGSKQSNETIQKRSKSLKGKPKPEGFGEKHSKKMRGKSKPKGFGELIRKARLGTKLPLGTGDKIGETKNKITLQYDLNNNFIKEYKSAKEAAKNMEVHEVTMRLHLGGKYKTCKGYIFKYK